MWQWRVSLSLISRMDAPEKEETSTRAALRRTNCRLRLLPRYLFSGSTKLILQGDSPGGSSPGDYPLLQEFASIRNLFFVYVFPQGNIFSQLSCPFTHGNEFCWLSAGKITFFLLISFSRKLINWGPGVKGLRLPYSCGARNYLLVESIPEDKWIERMRKMHFVQIK